MQNARTRITLAVTRLMRALWLRVCVFCSSSSSRAQRAWWMRLLPFLKPQKTPQVFLPQCERCSLIQSNAVRMDRRTLIFPRSWRWYDVWLPFPILLTLVALPAWEELWQRWQREKKAVEREATTRWF